MSDIAADITLKDNSAEVKRILKSAVKRGLKAIGMAAEGHADVGRFAWEPPLEFVQTLRRDEGIPPYAGYIKKDENLSVCVCV